MTSRECQRLAAGTVVLVTWPGSNSGVCAKRAIVRSVSKDGRMVNVNVGRTTPKGVYTGAWGSAVRRFYDFEILEVVE